MEVVMYRRKRYLNCNRDPREITARFDSVCAETGKPIKRGDTCIYYPIAKQVFHVDSETANKYRGWKQDLAMGYDY
jgi:hypothetical protein